MPEKPDGLYFIESIHEMREFNQRLIPEKGDFLELGKVEPVIEEFHRKENGSFRCVEHNKVDDETIEVVLEPITNLEEIEAEKDKLFDKIISEQEDELVLSMLKMLFRVGKLNQSSIRDAYNKLEKAEQRKNELQKAETKEKKVQKKKLYREMDKLEKMKKDVEDLKEDIKIQEKEVDKLEKEHS